MQSSAWLQQRQAANLNMRIEGFGVLSIRQQWAHERIDTYSDDDDHEEL
jgi:hypothetical protein